MSNNTSAPIGVSAADVVNWIPPLELMIGNYDIKTHLLERLGPDSTGVGGNLLLYGDPGTGKTVTLISFLRRLLGDDTIGYSDDADALTYLRGKQGFMRIDGGTANQKRLAEQVAFAMDNFTVHTHVLLDEIGELLFRNLDETIRPMLDNPRVTTYATAQNFHSKKRRGDTESEDKQRLAAIIRRFPVRLPTQLPDENELVNYLIEIMTRWGVRYESEETLRLLVRKSQGESGYVPNYAINCVVGKLHLRNPLLTTDHVMRYTADPLLG